MPKIMLVEDDNNLREIYGERLRAEGYEIVSAGDGEEALALAVKEKPDLIIADVMMPKISGFDMLDILRQTPETKNTKVIIMTALSQAEDRNRATKLGSDKYLVKSQVTLEDVARVVHDMIYGEQNPLGAKDPLSDMTQTDQPMEAEAEIKDDTPPVVTDTNAEPKSQEETIPQPLVFGNPQNNENPAFPTPAFQPVGNPAPDSSTATKAVPEPEAETGTDEENQADLNSNNPIVSQAAIEQAEQTSNPPAAEPANPFSSVPPATTAPEPDTANASQEPVVNPITGQTAEEITHTNTTDSAQAESTSDEVADVDQQIRNFVKSSPAEEPAHVAPLIEPTEQELIHAKNAAEDPKITKAATAPDPNNPATPNTAGMKVINPIDSSEPKTPSIYDLYEKEMQKEASNEAAAAPGMNSENGIVTQSVPPVNPIVTDTKPAIEPLQTIETNQIQGMAAEMPSQPEVIAPASQVEPNQNQAGDSHPSAGPDQIAL